MRGKLARKLRQKHRCYRVGFARTQRWQNRAPYRAAKREHRTR